MAAFGARLKFQNGLIYIGKKRRAMFLYIEKYLW